MAGERGTTQQHSPRICTSDFDQIHVDMAEIQTDSSETVGPTVLRSIEKIPDSVVEVARNGGIWRFKIEFRESTIPLPFLIQHHLVDRLLLTSSEAIRILWKEEWMHDAPDDLDGHRYRYLAKVLDAIVDPHRDITWFPESSLYAVGEDRMKHLCLTLACLDSKGTQCPRLAVGNISQQLADRASTNEDGRAEKFKSAVEYLGRVVQDTYNSHPNDPARMTAAMLALASSDNAFRRLMRV